MSKNLSFYLFVHLQTSILFFYGSFCLLVFPILCFHSAIHCEYWHCFTSFSQRLHKFFLFFWVDLRISEQNPCISMTQNPSPSWRGFCLDISFMSILAYNCLHRWTRHLQSSGDSSQGWTSLMQLHNSPHHFLADLFGLSHRIKPKCSVFQVWV